MRNEIIRTLCYSQVFNFPLTAPEIHQRLIGRKASLNSVKNFLNKSSLKPRRGFYYLGSPASVANRLKRQAISHQKIATAQSSAKLFKLLPSIQAVYITGAVAVGNAKADDDIDLLIITSPRTLWITRFLINSLLDLIGRRRRPNSVKLNNKLCLNLWLSSDHLSMPKSRRNLYTAYEIIQAKLLWGRHHTHRHFLWANRWLLKFLPNTAILKPSFTRRNPRVRQLADRDEGGPNTTLFENLAYIFQQKIMSAKQTREITTRGQAFFHPRNTQAIVETRYQQFCRRYL